MAGIFPLATVITASSDHIRIAVSPISVAVRGDMGPVIASQGFARSAPDDRLREAIQFLLTELDCLVATGSSQ